MEKEKKEIWMEKLVMLLDIYEEEVVWVHSVWGHITEKDEAWIISKQFWFIKWLVENDKIDREQKTKEFRLQIELDNWSYWELWWEARLLMLLAISDTPIEDLISYLK